MIRQKAGFSRCIWAVVKNSPITGLLGYDCNQVQASARKKEKEEKKWPMCSKTLLRDTERGSVCRAGGWGLHSHPRAECANWKQSQYNWLEFLHENQSAKNNPLIGAMCWIWGGGGKVVCVYCGGSLRKGGGSRGWYESNQSEKTVCLFSELW